MGSIISGEQWLLEMHRDCRAARRIMTALVRMQIKVGHQTGHLLVLGYEYTRRVIAHSARNGQMADVTITCQRCFCSATLVEWQASSTRSALERERLYVEMLTDLMGRKALYLAPCQGDDYARDVLEGTAEETYQ